MNCRKATRLLSEALDRELTFAERSALKIHTLICSGCRNFGRHMHSLRRISRAFTRGAADEVREQNRKDSPESGS